MQYVDETGGPAAVAIGNHLPVQVPSFESIGGGNTADCEQKSCVSRRNEGQCILNIMFNGSEAI
jgi:hypothetical protein